MRRTCLPLQPCPCLQNPRSYHGQSRPPSSPAKCRYVQSALEHSPYLEKKKHIGMRDRSYSCKNSHMSPFLHRPRNQCLHTTVRSLFVCRCGHAAPRTQPPRRKNLHTSPSPAPSSGVGSSVLSNSNTASRRPDVAEQLHATSPSAEQVQPRNSS